MVIPPLWLALLPRLRRFAVPVALVAALLAGGWWYGHTRYQAGAAVERAAWETRQRKAQEAARTEIAKREKRHAEEQGRIAERLAAVEQRAADDRERAAAVAADRLRRSDARADLYQRQAEAGAAAAGDLARHAAGLDRQLAEGIGVVADLRILVEQRDGQLMLLAAQIAADRAAVEGNL